MWWSQCYRVQATDAAVRMDSWNTVGMLLPVAISYILLPSFILECDVIDTILYDRKNIRKHLLKLLHCSFNQSTLFSSSDNKQIMTFKSCRKFFLFHLSCYVCYICTLSYVQLFAILWFFRQEYWSGLTFPSPGDLPTQGSNLSLMFPALAGGFFPTSATWEALLVISCQNLTTPLHPCQLSPSII